MDNEDFLTSDDTLELAYNSVLQSLETTSKVLDTQPGNFKSPDLIAGNAQVLLLLSIAQFLQEIRNAFVQNSERTPEPEGDGESIGVVDDEDLSVFEV